MGEVFTRRKIKRSGVLWTDSPIVQNLQLCMVSAASDGVHHLSAVFRRISDILVTNQNIVRVSTSTRELKALGL